MAVALKFAGGSAGTVREKLHDYSLIKILQKIMTGDHDACLIHQ